MTRIFFAVVWIVDGRIKALITNGLMYINGGYIMLHTPHKIKSLFLLVSIVSTPLIAWGSTQGSYWQTANTFFSSVKNNITDIGSTLIHDATNRPVALVAIAAAGIAAGLLITYAIKKIYMHYRLAKMKREGKAWFEETHPHGLSLWQEELIANEPQPFFPSIEVGKPLFSITEEELVN